jgi:hypothetical protein
MPLTAAGQTTRRRGHDFRFDPEQDLDRSNPAHQYDSVGATASLIDYFLTL